VVRDEIRRRGIEGWDEPRADKSSSSSAADAGIVSGAMAAAFTGIDISAVSGLSSSSWHPSRRSRSTAHEHDARTDSGQDYGAVERAAQRPASVAGAGLKDAQLGPYIRTLVVEMTNEPTFLGADVSATASRGRAPVGRCAPAVRRPPEENASAASV
jgi:hypothetical protein